MINNLNQEASNRIFAAMQERCLDLEGMSNLSDDVSEGNGLHSTDIKKILSCDLSGIDCQAFLELMFELGYELKFELRQ